MSGHRHRPTLKQQNKSFKSKHASKGSLKAAAKGRVGGSPKTQPLASAALAQTKLNRKNAAKQNQIKKRAELADEGKIFHGPNAAPRIVAVVPLCPDVSAQQTALQVVKAFGVDATSAPESGTWIIEAPRFRTALQFLILPYRQLYSTLDATHAADYTILALSPITEVDQWGERLLRILQSQGGLHNVVSVVSHPDGSKAQPTVQKSLLSFVQYFIPTQNRVFDLMTESDAKNAARALCEGVPRTGPASASWREGRAWMVAENVDWEESGELKITGVVRGTALSANRLVHIPSLGDFQISKILAAPRPRPQKHSTEVAMDVAPTDITLIAERQPSDADSLTSTNRPDEMTNEQTWPTAEELADGEAREAEALMKNEPTKKSRIKRVPKGTSAYQAAWIIDDADDEDEEDEDGDADMEKEEVDDQEEEEEMVELDEEAEDDQAMSVTNSKAGKSVAFEDMDGEEEARQLDTWRTREREDADDLAFPDEIDTPQDTPARTRFARFRGLRSFRTSPWDPYENLPKDYARTFQFEDYARTERSVRKYEDGHAAKPGTRVVVCVEGVPRDIVRVYGPGRPLVMFTLLQHEHKTSVLNFTVQRNTEYSESVRSKDPMILCVGPRRFHTNPIYSQHTRGGGKGVNNVHKFERYLRHGDTSVATIYGPVVFGKQPCTLLRETNDTEAPEFVGYGSFLNTDAQRIIAKRIILTGHPFKVHKKTATVRYMFFNPDDVRYFAPVQLHTKHGRTGHIRESLGTHGYFKAHFDGPLTQMDTICMSLYKRVYPRWSTLLKSEGTTDDAAMEE
ncbi:ribosome biogenesis TSR1-like protein [Rhizoctonia solani 123E]|uniref:Ribosome biogenesis TSR1-like protein n=1 Tax=Rhizoctonia solani 123E TaxID=1423351 RepID=A0A074RVG7_9AGAM|nr:ribosome biogenesis TSR1-like protein [Rhizoctonia solani 123E]